MVNSEKFASYKSSTPKTGSRLRWSKRGKSKLPGAPTQPVAAPAAASATSAHTLTTSPVSSPVCTAAKSPPTFPFSSPAAASTTTCNSCSVLPTARKVRYGPAKSRQETPTICACASTAKRPVWSGTRRNPTPCNLQDSVKLRRSSAALDPTEIPPPRAPAAFPPAIPKATWKPSRSSTPIWPSKFTRAAKAARHRSLHCSSPTSRTASKACASSPAPSNPAAATPPGSTCTQIQGNFCPEDIRSASWRGRWTPGIIQFPQFLDGLCAAFFRSHQQQYACLIAIHRNTVPTQVEVRKG